MFINYRFIGVFEECKTLIFKKSEKNKSDQHFRKNGYFE